MFRIPCTGLALIVLATLVCVLGTKVAQAAAPLDAEQIKAALKTATPEEEGFIEHVIDMVDQDTLPRDLFEQCFLWAKKKPRLRFQYFKRALILRAEKIGIEI